MVLTDPTGEAPEIWRVTRDQTVTCEECGRGPDDAGHDPLYRMISLTTAFDPALGICQDCTQEVWDLRLDSQEEPDDTGTRVHMFTGKPGNAY